MKTQHSCILCFALVPLALSGCFPPPAAPTAVADPSKAPAPRVEIRDNLLVLSQNIFFEFDSDVIKPESYGILDEAALVLNQHQEIGYVRIEGHTDNIGDAGYNIGLSERRARSVVLYLINKGVASSRVYPIGQGPKQPIADNGTETGRARNRRVVFAIEKWLGPLVTQAVVAPSLEDVPPSHYVTQSKKRLEVQAYSSYQTGRILWLAGGIATFVGIGAGALGATLITVGSVQSPGNPFFAPTQAGIGFTILGGIGAGAGIPLWVIGHKNVTAQEAGLSPSP